MERMKGTGEEERETVKENQVRNAERKQDTHEGGKERVVKLR